ncbi:MAG: hypothetical protein IPL92_03240 [Saprospiraceae bacterium]|nr:hypothetical protein [Candidatus Opimibacter iunctus]
MEIFAFPDFPAGTTFLWSTGETSTSIFITTSGTYSLTATAPGGACSSSVSEYIDMPFFPQPQPNISGPTVLCPGQNATLTAQGGSGDTYDWSTGAQTSSITISAPGTYSVTVTNSFGCTGTDTIEVLPGSTSPIISAPTVLCNGQNGTIEIVNASTYIDFLWSTGETTSSITINAPGTYSVTVTAAGGCTGTGSVIVASGSSNITINGNTSPVTSCSPQNGAVNITVAPSGTYTYLWSNAETSEDISNLPPGSYSVTVTDLGGCTSSDAFIVTSNVVIPSTSTSLTPSTCDLNNGAIDLSVTPSGTYTFSWSNGETTEDISNIFAGTYTVTVTSTSNGCTATASVTLTNINPTINITGSTTPFSSCTMPNGAIDITPSPAGTYSFTWSNGETTEDISNLSAGSYSVTVSAGGSCISSATYTVANNTISPVPAATIMATTCGQNNGTIDLNITPAGPYSFLWSNGATSEDLSSIPAGTYTVTVTDIGSGCSATISSIVPDNPIAITISGTTSPNTSCISNNGGIDITAQPVGTYSYLWSNGANTEDLNTLAPGDYSVTITLGVSCTQTATFQVLDNTTTILLIGTINPNSSCTQPNGAIDLSVSPNGTYTYIWSNGITSEDLNQLTGGTYAVTVTASNGCTATTTFDVVNTNSNYTFSGTVTPNNSCVSPNGSIDLTMNPPGSYTFLWSNGPATEDLNQLAAGTYGVTVSDINSCSSVATYSVTDSIVSPSITSQLSPETCGNQNGAIDLSIVPATGNTFLWSNGFTTEDISSLPVGLYTVTVTASNGCTAMDSFPITAQNTSITLSALVSPKTQCLLPNGAIDLTVSPAGIYSFIWSNNSTAEDISGLDSGSYAVTVTDAANCSSMDTFLIQNNTTLPLLSSTITPATCGAANGAIDLIVSPAINNSFLWSNGTISEDLQNILPGTYSVIVTDTISGCEVSIPSLSITSITTSLYQLSPPRIPRASVLTVRSI